MRSFFLSLLLWFALAVTVCGLAWLSVTILMQQDPLVPRLQNVVGPIMTLHAQTAAETYEREGTTRLSSYLAQVDAALKIRTILFDANGRRLGGVVAPSGAVLLAQRAERTGAARLIALRPFLMSAHTTRTADGRSYVLVSYIPGGLFSKAAVPVLRLLFVLATVCLTCYGFARHISTPVLRLRATTRRIAEGDLSARIGGTLGRRRDELAELGRDFDVMAARVEALIDAQRRLLGDISHELRSPLARLNVALELARRRSGAEASTALDRIEREVERLNELIGQLMTLTRLESGVEPKTMAPVDLARLTAEIVEDADFEAHSRERSVKLISCAPCRIRGNAMLLRSAIENVVRNAIRYTAERTAVEVSLRCSDVGGSRQAGIVVRDRGPGAPEEALAALFLPFYRVADSRERETGGVGLGLAITDRAVRLHGGTVTAHNADGGGLRIEILLPIEE